MGPCMAYTSALLSIPLARTPQTPFTRVYLFTFSYTQSNLSDSLVLKNPNSLPSHVPITLAKKTPNFQG
jgi:hypothetical protein